MKNSIKKILFAFFGLIITTFFLFLISETILRIVNPSNISLLTQEKKNFFYQDSFFHHFRHSNLDIIYDYTGEYSSPFRSDKNGFLLNYHPNKNETPKRKIVILGDSYVEAIQLDEKQRLSALIEEHCLNEGIDSRVYNWGFSSYSPMLEERLIKKFWHDDITDVVLVLWPLNDITADYKFRDNELFAPRIKAKKNSSPIYLVHFYYLYIKPLLRNAVLNVMGENFLKKRGMDVGKWKTQYDKVDLTESGEGLFGEKVTENDIKAINTTIFFLNRIQDFVQSNNASFSIAVLPPGPYISNDQWDSGYGPTGLFVWSEEKENKVVYNEIIRRIKEEGFESIDLLNTFTSKYNLSASKFYFPIDGHLNAYGHQVCAEEIFKNFIKSK